MNTLFYSTNLSYYFYKNKKTLPQEKVAWGYYLYSITTLF